MLRHLLYLLNELRKSEKMRGLSSILSLFRNEFNKFNNTRAQKLDYIKIKFWRKKLRLCHWFKPYSICYYTCILQ